MTSVNFAVKPKEYLNKTTTSLPFCNEEKKKRKFSPIKYKNGFFNSLVSKQKISGRSTNKLINQSSLIDDDFADRSYNIKVKEREELSNDIKLFYENDDIKYVEDNEVENIMLDEVPFKKSMLDYINVGSKSTIERILYIQRAWRRYFLVKNYSAEFIQKHIRRYLKVKKFKKFVINLEKIKNGVNILSMRAKKGLKPLYSKIKNSKSSVFLITNFQRMLRSKMKVKKLLNERTKKKSSLKPVIMTKDQKSKNKIQELNKKVKLIQKTFSSYLIRKLKNTINEKNENDQKSTNNTLNLETIESMYSNINVDNLNGKTNNFYASNSINLQELKDFNCARIYKNNSNKLFIVRVKPKVKESYIVEKQIVNKESLNRLQNMINHLENFKLNQINEKNIDNEIDNEEENENNGENDIIENDENQQNYDVDEENQEENNSKDINEDNLSNNNDENENQNEDQCNLSKNHDKDNYNCSEEVIVEENTNTKSLNDSQQESQDGNEIKNKNELIIKNDEIDNDNNEIQEEDHSKKNDSKNQIDTSKEEYDENDENDENNENSGIKDNNDNSSINNKSNNDNDNENEDIGSDNEINKDNNHENNSVEKYIKDKRSLKAKSKSTLKKYKSKAVIYEEKEENYTSDGDPKTNSVKKDKLLKILQSIDPDTLNEILNSLNLIKPFSLIELCQDMKKSEKQDDKDLNTNNVNEDEENEISNSNENVLIKTNLDKHNKVRSKIDSITINSDEAIQKTILIDKETKLFNISLRVKSKPISFNYVQTKKSKNISPINHIIFLQKAIKNNIKLKNSNGRVITEEELNFLKSNGLNNFSSNKTNYVDFNELNKNIITIQRAYRKLKKLICNKKEIIMEMNNKKKSIEDLLDRKSAIKILKNEPIGISKCNLLSHHFIMEKSNSIKRYFKNTLYKIVSTRQNNEFINSQSKDSDKKVLENNDFETNFKKISKEKNVFYMSGKDVIENPFNKLSGKDDPGLIVIKKRMLINRNEIVKKYEKSIIKNESLEDNDELQDDGLLVKRGFQPKPIITFIKDHISIEKTYRQSSKPSLFRTYVSKIQNLFFQYLASVKKYTLVSRNSIIQPKKFLIKKSDVNNEWRKLIYFKENNQLNISNNLNEFKEDIIKYTKFYSIKNSYHKYASKIQRNYVAFKLRKISKEAEIIKKKKFIVRTEYDTNFDFNDEDYECKNTESSNNGNKFSINDALKKANFKKIIKLSYMKYLNKQSKKITFLMRKNLKFNKLKNIISKNKSFIKIHFSNWINIVKNTQIQISHIQKLNELMNKQISQCLFTKIRDKVYMLTNKRKLLKKIVIDSDKKKNHLFTLVKYLYKLKNKVTRIGQLVKFSLNLNNVLINVLKKYAFEKIQQKSILMVNKKKYDESIGKLVLLIQQSKNEDLKNRFFKNMKIKDLMKKFNGKISEKYQIENQNVQFSVQCNYYSGLVNKSSERFDLSKKITNNIDDIKNNNIIINNDFLKDNKAFSIDKFIILSTNNLVIVLSNIIKNNQKSLLNYKYKEFFDIIHKERSKKRISELSSKYIKFLNSFKFILENKGIFKEKADYFSKSCKLFDTISKTFNHISSLMAFTNIFNHKLNEIDNNDQNNKEVKVDDNSIDDISEIVNKEQITNLSIQSPLGTRHDVKTSNLDEILLINDKLINPVNYKDNNEYTMDNIIDNNYNEMSFNNKFDDYKQKNNNLFSSIKSNVSFGTCDDLIKSNIFNRELLTSYQVEDKEVDDIDTSIPFQSTTTGFGKQNKFLNNKKSSKSKKKFRFVMN